MSATDLIKELGDIIQTNTEAALGARSYIDTGYVPLNMLLSGDPNGGFFQGRIHEIFGMQSCGKTAIATLCMTAAIEAGGLAQFEDAERSFDLEQGRHLGLPADSGRFIYQKPNTFEESVSRILKLGVKVREKKLIPPEAPIVTVLDSLASCIPQAIVAKLTSTDGESIEDVNMKDDLALAAATSRLMKVIANFAERYGMTIIILNQLRENPVAGYGDNTKTPGGKATGFHASTRLKLTSAKLSKKVDGKDVQIGQQITAYSLKNKTYRPFVSTKWDFLYDDNGRGHFDIIGGHLEYLKDTGRIEVDGNRFVWEGKKWYKSQLSEHIAVKGLQDELNKLCRA